MADVFDEHLGVIAALKENYARPDDRNAIVEIARAQAEVTATIARGEAAVREAIQALTSCAEDARSRSTYPGRESEHAEQTAALRAAASASSEEASALRARLESLSRERESLEERVQGLRRQAKSLEDDAARAEPRLRHELALYAHATRLSWDFSRRTRVAGSVAGNDDVRAFDLGEEERRENAVAVADALWEAVGDA